MRAAEGYRQNIGSTHGHLFQPAGCRSDRYETAAAAGYESNLDKDKAVAQAMKMAADRILAEAFLAQPSTARSPTRPLVRL